jgi:hypothetical protein
MAPAVSSTRATLARLARAAAIATTGVVETTSGPTRMWVTMDRVERIPGVVSTALPDGTYGVELHLTAGLVPLHPLADSVRGAVGGAIRAAGLGDSLGPIDIAIDDIAPAPPVGSPPLPSVPPSASPPSPAPIPPPSTTPPKASA